MSGIKIQINDAKGVEKLIESDDDLKVEIKKAIINGFAKNYLKAAATEDVLKKLKRDVIDELHRTDCFGMLVKDSRGFRTYMGSRLEELIEKEVENSVNRSISDAIHEEELKIISKIEERVDHIMKKYDDDTITEIMDSLVEKKIREFMSRK